MVCVRHEGTVQGEAGMEAGGRIADCRLPALRPVRRPVHRRPGEGRRPCEGGRLGEGGRISSFAKATEDGADLITGGNGVNGGIFPLFSLFAPVDSSHCGMALHPIHPMRPFFGILSISTKPVDIVMFQNHFFLRLLRLFAAIQRKCLSMSNLQQIMAISN